jgi:hypothetical protein
LGQNILLDITGVCKEYNVTVTISDFEIGCYDVKVDITTPAGRVGKIFDHREGWKSSIYYVNEGFCVEEANQSVSKMFQLQAETSSSELNFKGSIRHGSKIWTTGYYEVSNKCSQIEPQDDIVVLFIVIISIEIFLLGFVIYDIMRNR